ncbi:MAG: phage tail tape measure protein [Megasphaera cerevisiae]|jgi:TP901 family phage tail tape measure protein|nr:phage tail tape measure protein [Megasphaera cerevisiae]
MDNFVLSATLELKDRFTSNVKKARSGFTDFTKSLQSLSPAVDGAASSMQKAGGSAQTLAAKADKAKASLSGIRGTYAATVRAKDEATQTVRRVKTELSQIKGKTYTAIINVRQNMEQGGPLNKLTSGASGVASGMLMGTSMQMAGAAGIGVGVYDAIKNYSDFTAQLSEVKALTDLDADAMEQVKAKAMQLGDATVFSTTDAAKGMTELLKAGVSVKDVLGAASEAALDLASAGGLALPEAAEIMSTAMNAFHMDDATHAADILAGAANASATSVEELRYSLAACSAVAAGAGMSFDDTNTALAVFAQNGLKGSDAGTSLKTMLSNLVPKGKTAIMAFERLNLLTEKGSSAFFDEAGKMKSLADIADLLQDRMKDMTDEEKMSTLYDMFGSDAIRGGMILLREGAKGVSDMYGNMSKVTAKDTSAQKMDNLRGSLDKLSSAWENLTIKLLDGKAGQSLRALVDEVTNLTHSLSSALDDGFQFTDMLKVAAQGITDLKDKALVMDGVGSVLAAGAMIVGLTKIIRLARRAQGYLGDLVKAPSTTLPGSPGSGDGLSGIGDMVVHAKTVIVNGSAGSTTPGAHTTGGPATGSTPKGKSPSRWGGLGRTVRGAAKTGGGIAAILSAIDMYATYQQNTMYDEEAQYGVDLEQSKADKGEKNDLTGAKAYQTRVAEQNRHAMGASIASIGSNVGGVIGTAIGGPIGGVLGYMAGSYIGTKIGDAAAGYDWGALQKSFSSTLDQMGADIAAAGPRFTADWAGITKGIQSEWSNTTAYLDTTQAEFKASFTAAWNEMCQQAAAKNQEWAQSFAAAKTSAGQSLDELKTWAGGVWDTIAQGATSAATTIQNKLSGAWEYIKQNAPSLSMPSFNLGGEGLGHNATGTTSWRGGWTEINERGGEIVDLPGGSRIYPHATTVQMLQQQFAGAGHSGAPQINISGNTFVVREEGDIHKIAYELMRLTQQAADNYGGAY